MATVDEVLDVVKETRKNTEELLIWKGEVDERCRGHQQKTEELRDTIYGSSNPGSSGLKSSVEKLLNCKKAISKREEFWLFIIRYVIGALTVVFILWVVKTFKIVG